MAIELNKRTKILAGVVVLAAAGAAAWFFFLQDFLDEPPPRPVAAGAPAKGAPKDEAPKADAAKAGAEKAAAAKPAAEPAKQADAPKPAATAAAPAAKPAAKPIPSNPDQAVAEFLEASGAKAQLQQVARDVTRGAQLKDPAAAKEFAAILERVFEPNAMLAEVTANLKQSYDAGRMSRYLEHLRQPIVVKINAMGAEARGVPAEAMKAQMDEMDKNPPSAERAKLLARSEELDRMRGLGTEIGAVMGRGYAEGVLEYLHSSRSGNAALTQIGKGNPRNARAALLSQVTHNQGERIKAAVTRRAVAYRGASDAELAEYLKAIDTEIGEWGATTLAGALKPVFEKRGHEQGRTFAQFAFGGKRVAASTTAPAPAEKPAVAASASKPAADTPVSKPAAATPPEPVGYQRAANIRPLYTRYNDLMSATVMRDRAAVKELLDDGKFPNVRQKDGSTPLMVAASNGDADIASMLLAKGADPNLRAAGGVSALSLARARGAAGNEMVQLLQRSGAKD